MYIIKKKSNVIKFERMIDDCYWFWGYYVLFGVSLYIILFINFCLIVVVIVNEWFWFK